MRTWSKANNIILMVELGGVMDSTKWYHNRQFGWKNVHKMVDPMAGLQEHARCCVALERECISLAVTYIVLKDG